MKLDNNIKKCKRNKTKIKYNHKAFSLQWNVHYCTEEAMFVFIYMPEARGKGIPQPRYGFIPWRNVNAYNHRLLETAAEKCRLQLFREDKKQITNSETVMKTWIITSFCFCLLIYFLRKCCLCKNSFLRKHHKHEKKQRGPLVKEQQVAVYHVIL